MIDLPTREKVGYWRKGQEGMTRNQRNAVLDAYASGRLVDRETMIPMYRQGGLSGAWYPEVGGDDPDGWLAIGDTDE